MSQVVYFRGGRREAARIIRAMVGTLTGHGGTSELAKGVFYTLGFAALSDIQADFVRKARGGVGEDGNQWPRLSPKTLAYSRRFGPGEQSALKKAAGLGRGSNHGPGGKDGLLTKAQLKRWRQIYGTRLARLAASMPFGAAKARAASIAWAAIKAEGAKTKLEVYGNRTVEVLRDTGILLNSLSMGQLDGDGNGMATYTPPSVPGGDQQVFETLQNGVIVGTNVPYAASHNYGDAKRGIPARPFIPKPDQVPQVWLERWLNAGMQAVAVAIRTSLETGGVR